MNLRLFDWFPALTTSGLLAAALWFARNLIVTRLTKSVEHQFNSKLEHLRADLKKRETEIAALQSGALSALASRQAALDRRRLEAVDQLWSAVTALAPARGIVASLGVIKFEEAAARAERDPRLREFFELIGGKFSMAAVDLSGAAKARPFVTPMVWAVFSAMLAVITHTVVRLQVLKGGLGSQDFVSTEGIEKLVTAVLPHYGDYLKRHGPSVYTHVLEALDSRLIQEIQSMLTGAADDKASVDQAAEIVRQANEVLSASEATRRAA